MKYQMVKGDATMIFLVASPKRSVAIMALKQGGIPAPQGPVAGYNIPCVDDSPPVLGEYTKGVPFLFIYKKEKENLIIEVPKDSSNSPLRT